MEPRYCMVHQVGPNGTYDISGDAYVPAKIGPDTSSIPCGCGRATILKQDPKHVICATMHTCYDN